MTPGGLGTVLLLALAGGIGAALRFGLDSVVTARVAGRTRMPVGIALINVVGSFLLGALTGASAAVGATGVLVLGVGLLGGFTTFSTAMVDGVRLWQDGLVRQACVLVGGTWLLSLISAWAGVVFAAITLP